VTELQIAHTADAGGAVLAAARALLADIFAGDFDDHDWEHALGGMHALLWDDGALIGHAAVVQRRLLHGGRALRTGYVEGVGVRADRQGRGHGGTLMAALERIIGDAYDLHRLGQLCGPHLAAIAPGTERELGDDEPAHASACPGRHAWRGAPAHRS
jgi:aminoglycoside 2'-N-acetyltransferase I